MIAMTINALPSAATGLSPYFVEYGKEFRLPILKRLMKQVDLDDAKFHKFSSKAYAKARAD